MVLTKPQANDISFWMKLPLGTSRNLLLTVHIYDGQKNIDMFIVQYVDNILLAFISTDLLTETN